MRTDHPRRVLAIDPGTTRHAWALLKGTELVDHGTLEAWQLLEISRLLRRCHRLVIEDQYFGHLRGAKTLIRMAWEPVVLAKLRGVPFQVVPASTWRRRLWGKLRLDRKAWKARAVEEVRRRYGKAVNPDAAEAICMGLAMTQEVGTAHA